MSFYLSRKRDCNTGGREGTWGQIYPTVFDGICIMDYGVLCFLIFHFYRIIYSESIIIYDILILLHQCMI